MSFPAHLTRYKDHFYYQARVPVDLKVYFKSTFIKKSLRTTNLNDAKNLLVAMEYKVCKAFTALRTGMLSSHLVGLVVEDIQPAHKKVVVTKSTLSKVIDQYVKEKERGWTYKTKMEVHSCHRILLDILGDTDIKSINRAKALEFRDIITKLPPNMYKRFPNRKIKEILSVPDIKPMSIKSANKYILRLNALLSYAFKEGILSTNPATGLMLEDKRRDDELRKTYSEEDIQKILLYLPCSKDRPERYWIPRIAMYSGLRLDELCQLYVDDVIQIDGIWCFDVNDRNDKKVKVESSKRTVPIHPKLISLGFLAFHHDAHQKKEPRLWSALSWRKEDGYSNGFGRWYRDFNRHSVTDDPKKVFHSFRHTVADTLKQAGVQESVISEILGHTHKSITTGRYGKRYQPSVLLEAIVKLDYG